MDSTSPNPHEEVFFKFPLGAKAYMVLRGQRRTNEVATIVKRYVARHVNGDHGEFHIPMVTLLYDDGEERVYQLNAIRLHDSQPSVFENNYLASALLWKKEDFA